MHKSIVSTMSVFNGVAGKINDRYVLTFAFAGSEVQRMLEGSGDNCSSDTILAGAGLTVY